MEEYRTVLKKAQAEFTERHSRFIGSAEPVASKEEAEDFIRSVRAQNREAKHHVFAYILRESNTERCSDDGEPQGTAGVPVLDVLLKSGLTDTAVVVTRYFGGILLGTGGLIRAYSHAVSLVLAQAGIADMRACYTAELQCGYGQYGRVGPLIAAHGGTQDETAFAEIVRIRFHMPCEAADGFQTALTDATCGECSAEFGLKKFYKI